MGGEVTRGGNEDRRRLWVTAPGEILAHGGLQVLHHVEAGVLAHQGMAEERNQIRSRITGCDVHGGKPRSFGDLLLPIAGIEERTAKRGRWRRTLLA
jgi:hypothetical protein